MVRYHQTRIDECKTLSLAHNNVADDLEIREQSGWNQVLVMHNADTPVT